MATLDKLLKMAAEQRASDLHLSANTVPTLRKDGTLVKAPCEKLDAEMTEHLIYEILTSEQRGQFETDLELDFSYSLPGVGRFRVNLFRERGAVAAAFRVISSRIRTLPELGCPPVVSELARRKDGLVIVTGPVGMGKTTTLAAMIDQINREEAARVIIIEDPIEYVHANLKSTIMQREIGADSHSFAAALKHAIRQDPNVICVGEMRDLETISVTLTAAETGHLVLATLHTRDTAQTMDRIIDVFPPHQQQQIRVQLAMTLQGIVAQQLLPRLDGKGRVLATETLVANDAIRNLIRENKVPQIYTVIQTNKDLGMQTMDESLMGLYGRGVISYDVAVSRATDPGAFRRLM